MVSPALLRSTRQLPDYLLDAAAEERDPNSFDPTKNLRGKLSRKDICIVPFMIYL